MAVLSPGGGAGAGWIVSRRETGGVLCITCSRTQVCCNSERKSNSWSHSALWVDWYPLALSSSDERKSLLRNLASVSVRLRFSNAWASSFASTGVDFVLSNPCRGVYVPEVGSSSPKVADPLLVKPQRGRGDDDIKG